MSGIYCRPNYDESYYSILKNTTEGPNKQIISSERIESPYCIHSNIPMASRAAFMSSLDYKNMNNLIDLESHLKNIDLPLSHEINGRTIHERNKISNKINNNIIKEDCNYKKYDFLDINTRLENPPIFIREETLSRFDFPIVPHTNYYYNGYDNTLQTGNNRSGVNTRLIAKDSIVK
jgi:hypothetical protein